MQEKRLVWTCKKPVYIGNVMYSFLTYPVKGAGHDCFAEGGDGFPFPLAPDHGLNQGRTREVAAAYYLDDDMAVPFPGSVHLDCVLHRVFRAVHIVVT
ncbi:hypothetical protein B5X24_HaOG213150 [Helicoverpa armigera]|nr:hypothetical protein B5X24_HaOG213150 [Helicoverpa armigera]